MTSRRSVSLSEILLSLREQEIKPRISARAIATLVGSRPWRRHSIGRLVEDHARRSPGQTALRFEDESWSYREFNAAANRYADAFARAGLGAGDVVAIDVTNRPEALFAVTATVKLGAIAGMINTSQQSDVLLHSLSLIEPDLLVIGDERVDAYRELGDELPAVRCGALTLADPRADDPQASPTTDSAASDERIGRVMIAALPPEGGGLDTKNPSTTRQIRLDSPAFYIFTSGTTGLPKASIMTHRRWFSAMGGIGIGAGRLTADDTLYCSLPLYHNNALTVSWGAVLGASGTFAIARRFSASGFWDDVRRHDATAFCYIGELCRYLLNQPPKPDDADNPVHTAIGNGLRPAIWSEFKQRFGIDRIGEFYAASEGNVGFVNALNLDETIGFCPYPYAIVRWDPDDERPIRNQEGRLERVEPGGTGLLIGKITSIAPYDGYTDDEASERKLLRDVFRDGDCWFNSGDLVRDIGWRHAQFVDRIGDTFRWKGENVATTEVEAVLNRSPQIDESVVYGVTVPGTEGRAGMAAVTLVESVDALDGAALAAFLRDELPPYAVPRFLRVRGAQEVTGTFKYKKSDLKRAGFDPDEVDEPLFFLADDAEAYAPVDRDAWLAIERGETRL